MARDPEEDDDAIDLEPDDPDASDDPDAWRDYCDDPYGDEED
jgi:hypothetical protein